MIHKIYTIFDSKALVFGNIFIQKTNGEAIRSFSEVANDPQSAICKYPEDFCLMEIGTFDDTKGQLTSLNAPINLGLAQEFKRAPRQLQQEL